MAGGIQSNYAQGALLYRRGGVQADYSQGTLIPFAFDVTVNITGSEATYSQGDLLANLPLVGEASTGATGTLGPNITLALSGSGTTFGQGIVGVALEADDTFASFSTGSVSPVSAVAVTGQQVTGSQGDFILDTQALTSLLGVYQHYNLFAGMTKDLVGLQATYGQGNLTASGGVPFIPPPSIPAIGGGKVLRSGRYRIRWHGHDKVFEGLDELIEALEEEATKVREEAVQKAHRDAKLVIKGKGKEVAPQLRAKSSLPEIQSLIDTLQAKIDEVYKSTLFDEVGRLVEIEDIKFLSDLEI